MSRTTFAALVVAFVIGCYVASTYSGSSLNTTPGGSTLPGNADQVVTDPPTSSTPTNVEYVAKQTVDKMSDAPIPAADSKDDPATPSEKDTATDAKVVDEAEAEAPLDKEDTAKSVTADSSSCDVEAMHVKFTDYNALWRDGGKGAATRCAREPLRLGNLTTRFDIAATVEEFPSINANGSLDYVTDADRRDYWRYNPDPEDPQCMSCKHNLVHPPLYRARRWWTIGAWSVDGKRQSCNILLLHETKLTCIYASISAATWKRPSRTSYAVNRTTITRLGVYIKGSTGQIAFQSRALDDAGKDVVLTHQIGFYAQAAGAKCFWRSIQLLYPELLPNAFRLDTYQLAGLLQDKTWSAHMERSSSFPYTPCYQPYMTSYVKKAMSMNNVDTYKTFWPRKCSAKRDQRPVCKVIRDHQADEKQTKRPLRVALTFAGFLRSFGSSRYSIWDHIVKPLNATVFGCTWNVMGRAKKTKIVHKKYIFSIQQMASHVRGFLGLNPEDKGRINVLNYHRHQKLLKIMEMNGFSHGGLYLTYSKALDLVYSYPTEFDVVIRTRWDILPRVPFHLSWVPNSNTEVLMEMPTSCLLQGRWFPQTFLVEPNKLIKHYADTRFKLFAYQVCDWMDVGLYDTMREVRGIYDWIVENNVFSAAQFVDHAYLVDRGISYQVANLQLKILRNKGRVWG